MRRHFKEAARHCLPRQTQLVVQIDEDFDDGVVGFDRDRIGQELAQYGRLRAQIMTAVAAQHRDHDVVNELVESNDELHTLLSGLPLFSCMDIRVTPLATHPSDIRV